MAITVPSAGDDILATYGAAVANQLNQFVIAQLAADVSKTGATFSDITGLSFACVSGYEYQWEAALIYECAGTNTGLSVSHDHPGGTSKQLVNLFGETSGSVSLDSWNTGTDTHTGSSVTAAANTTYIIRMSGFYLCTSSGTFALRYRRNGTSATVTISKSSRLMAYIVA